MKRVWLVVAMLATVAWLKPADAQVQVNHVRFELKAVPAIFNCLAQFPADPSRPPTAVVRVTRQRQNDFMTITLHNIKPHLAFDLFTVQRSRFNADGTLVNPFTNFGLAWYQTDLQINAFGDGSAQIRTILLDQIFGFDPDVSLPPTNTFHVGFWFNNPADAAACGFTGTTPFNGEHNAGPLAMISLPDSVTGLGPLCTKASCP